jgi:transposase
MKEVSIIGVDLAKNVFQLHGASADGTVVFRKKLSRPQFQRFIFEHPRCLVAMEACGGAHYWAREMERADHEVRLIAPRYVKPFIKLFVRPECRGDQQAANVALAHLRGLPEPLLAASSRPAAVQGQARLQNRVPV